MTADGPGTTAIMRQAGVAETAVWRWQERFMQGRGGRAAPTRPDPHAPPLSPETVKQVIALTLAIRRRGYALDRRGYGQVSSAASARVPILAPPPPAPHRTRHFELSTIRSLPEAARCRRPYVDLPAHAVVMLVDEKSQIHALDRTQPGLPLKRPARHHDA